TQFTVKRGVMGSTAGSIANDVYLLKIGTAFAEGTSEPKASSRNPVKYKNYTQIFKTVYDVTGTASKTKARTGDLLKNERKRKSFDHGRDQELALLFGRASELAGDNGKPKRTMDGLRRFIPSTTTTVFSSSITFTGASDNFFDASYKVFDFESEAGDTRIGICGNGALNAINKAVADSAGEVKFDKIVTLYGMNLRELVLPQGRLLLRTHPMLN